MVAVVNTEKHHAERIQVNRGIRRSGNVRQLGCRISADIFFRQTGILQILQSNETEIAQDEFAGLHEVDIFRLNVAEEITGLTAGGNCIAHIQPKIDCTQVRHGTVGNQIVQRDIQRIEYVDIKTYAGFFSFHLIIDCAGEITGCSELFPNSKLGFDILNHSAVILIDSSFIGIGAGEDQSIDLIVGCGNGHTF